MTEAASGKRGGLTWPALGRRVRALVDALQRRPFLVSAAALAIAVGVAAVMAGVAGPRAVRRVIEHPHPAWLVELAVGQALAYLGYAVAHRAMTRVRDGPEISLGLSLQLVAVGFGPFALGGGFAVDRRALIGLGASPRAATVRVLALGSLEYAALAPAAAVAAITLLGSPHVERALTLPWAIAVPVGFAVGLWVAAPARRRRLCAGPGRARAALGRGLEGVGLLRVLLAHPVRHRQAWLGVVIYWAGDIISLWAGLRLFEVRLSLAALVLAYATGYALTPRTLPLAGVGVTEALMPLALTWVGLGLAPAVAGVAAYRILGLLLSIPAAMLAWPAVTRLGRRGRTGPRSPSKDSAASH